MENSYSKKQIWHSIVTTLAAIVVFVTTYALIIPAITWESTLICELEEHVHTDKCFNDEGELVCKKTEHTHTAECFDAPKAEDIIYVCGKTEHTHTEECYFEDGTLKCTLKEHTHTNACFNIKNQTITSNVASDGAVAVISGEMPETASAEIKAVSLSDQELLSLFGTQKAYLTTSYVAYDIKIMVDGKEWQPEKRVSVTIEKPEIEFPAGDRLLVAHVENGTNKAKAVSAKKSENGDVVFEADGFSVYVIYTAFTVDFSYNDVEYSIVGLDSIRLSELFARLEIDKDTANVQNVLFSDTTLLRVEPTYDGDWVLTSLQPFTTEELLTVNFSDGTTISIDTRDAVTSTTVTWDPTNKEISITVEGKNEGKGGLILSYSVSRTIYLQYAGAQGSYSDATSQYVAANEGFSITYTLPNTGDISSYMNWRVTGDAEESYTATSLGTIYYLMDGIDVSDSVLANYTGKTFSAWIESDYVGNEQYLNPSTPTTMAELMTAYDYFYSGEIEPPNVWCYHDGETEPYKKVYTLYDATTGNSALLDGDVIELQGDTVEKKQTVIQKSITVKSASGHKYTIDFVPTNGYFIYEEGFDCDKHADPNGPAVTTITTRDCITVCPAVFGTELEVLFKNVVLDGFDASHKDGDVHDYHILQTIHNVELTFSGVTVQNYNIQSNLNSNGAISLDGRTTYNSATGAHGNKLILQDDCILQGLNSYRGDPYSTGGIMVNSAEVEISDTVIQNCSSRNGPAITLDSSSTVYLHDGTDIKNCHAQVEGGAVRNSGKLYIETGATIQSCTPQTGSTALKGGAVYSKGTVYMSGGEIKNNTADKGGAIYNDGTLYVSGGNISGNTATDDSKDFGDVSATLGSAIYQNGTMYLSGAPVYADSQDIYLPEGHVITKDGGLTSTVKLSVVLDDEVRFRDILVSQSASDKVVSDANLLKLNVKLSQEAIVDVDGKMKSLAAVYNEAGLNGAAADDTKNVIELDVSETLVVKKVWEGDEEGTTHDPITVYLYKDGVANYVDHMVLSKDNGWTGTFTNLEVASDGTLPYHVEEVAVHDYITKMTDIEFIDGRESSYWVPANPNSLSAGEFVIAGPDSVLSHNGGTLTTSTPTLTNESININGTNYAKYYKGSSISDNMVWVASAATGTLKTRPVTGQTQYNLRYNSSAIRLNSSYSTDWYIYTNNGKSMLRQSGQGRYLNLGASSFYTSDTNYATAITLYKKVETTQTAGHYELTITNRKIVKTKLVVTKEWSDGNENHTEDEVVVKLTSSYGEDPVTKTLNAVNEWSVEFTDLIAPGEGEPFGYTITESEVEGYASFIGETEFVEGAEGVVWIPVTTITNGREYILISGGNMIRRTGSGSIGVTSVTIDGSIVVNNRSYASSVSNSKVSDSDIWTASKSAYSTTFTLENGGEYIRNNSTPIGSSSNAASLSLNNTSTNQTTGISTSRISLGQSNGNTYFLRVNGSTVTRSTQSYASYFSIYEKAGDGNPTADSYAVTIKNKKLVAPSGDSEPIDVLTKKIDYLGDGGTNDDTTQTGEDLYRLYLQASANSEPIDLLIVADVSNSMRNNGVAKTGLSSGDVSRYVVLDKILNGTPGTTIPNQPSNENTAKNASRQADGLVYNFLNDNPENRVAVIGFARDTDIRTPKYTVSNNRRWVSAADINSTNPKDYFVNVHLSPMANSDTNYINGIVDAETELLRYRNSDSKLVIIFLTDGLPDATRYNTNPTQSIATGVTAEDAGTASALVFQRILGGAYKGYNNDSSVAYDYSDASLFLVGIGSEAATGDGKTVLESIARETGGETYLATSDDMLDSALNDIVERYKTRVNVVFDQLSDYVDFADVMDIKITVKEAGSTTETILYNNGGKTTANTVNGKQIVDSVIISGKTITVKFTDDYQVDPNDIFTVSYNVQRTDSALGNGPDTGDEGTDYSANTTSSARKGFYANEQAYAIYKNGDSLYKGSYPHPVVQGAVVPITPEEPPEPEFADFDDKVQISKKIDYLGDNTGVDGMDALYRLYLTLKAQENPIDLLLVIDQSASMAKTVSDAEPGDDALSRQQELLNFLNGTETDHSDGFIYTFRRANANNDIAVLTFSQDCSLSDNRYVRKWGETGDTITLATPAGATNYTAAYDIASKVLAQKATGTNQKILIFLSDGEPTLAYSDGKMQSSFAYKNGVGAGRNYAFNSAAALLGGFMIHARDELRPNSGAGTRQDWLNGLLGNSTIVDDSGKPFGSTERYVSYHSQQNYSGASGSTIADPDFPVLYDITTAKFQIPGMESMYGDYTEEDGSTFLAWYDNYWSKWTMEERYAWMVENTIYPGDSYNIFWLTESSFAEFVNKNPNVITFTICFSTKAEDTYGPDDTGTEISEVLKYMSGEDRFYPCTTASSMASAFDEIVPYLTNITMTDKLSEYVAFTVDPDLVIKITDDKFSNTTTYPDYPYLYKDGDFTDLGELLLDTTATKIDKANRKVSIVMNSSLGFNENLEIEASFTVELTEKAYADKATYGTTYNGTIGELGPNGELITDYDSAHNTSSGKPGFLSNDSTASKASWTLGGKHTVNFQKPVVQVPDTVDFALRKVSTGSSAVPLSGANFDLYLEVPESQTGSIVYTDASGVSHHLVKMNSAALVSTADSTISLTDMRVGRYFLFETRSPDGYVRLNAPVVFELALDKIVLPTGAKDAAVNGDNVMLLDVKNTSSYEMPETGGRGTKLYTLSGLTLMAGALVYGCMMGRKRERRAK